MMPDNGTTERTPLELSDLGGPQSSPLLQYPPDPARGQVIHQVLER
jgi:hypothetical protein